MKVALFTNHKVGILLLQSLFNSQQLSALVIPKKDFPGKNDFLFLCQIYQCPFIEVEAKDLKGNARDWLTEKAPDIIIVNAFPYLLPTGILSVPKHGGWNFHASPLPEYRGAVPLFWQIADGKQVTELCLHQMTEEFDEGAVFAREQVHLHPADTHDTAMNRIAQHAPKMTAELIGSIARGETLPLEEQPQGDYKIQGKPSLNDITIDWSIMKTEEIQCLVRACNPTGTGAIAWFRGIEIRLSEVQCITLKTPPTHPPGTFLTFEDNPNLYILCKGGSCLRVMVIIMEEAICSGESFRTLFQVNNGEALMRH